MWFVWALMPFCGGENFPPCPPGEGAIFIYWEKVPVLLAIFLVVGTIAVWWETRKR